jgi:hypothetical protein
LSYLVNDKKVAMGDSRSSLSRDLIPPAHINHIDDIIRQLSRIVRREIITSTLYKQELAAELGLERLECSGVGGDVLADSGVRAAAGLDGKDAHRGEGLVLDEELLVFAGKDVVGHDGCIMIRVSK